MKVVISQPMFLPWIGLFEQIKLADVLVHYDDVQLPKGRSFMSRVQVKGPNGMFWLTAPVDRRASGKLITETRYQDDQRWRQSHLARLRHSYQHAPHLSEMMSLAEQIYSVETHNLAEFNQSATERIARWLGIDRSIQRSSKLGIRGAGTQRLLDICEHLGATTYITGHGARNYLDHDLFDDHRIRVEYMDYQKTPYPQLHGSFVPYVTVLDAIANCGKDAAGLISSQSIYWQEFTDGSN